MLSHQVELFEARASESCNVNTALETCINELRRERADQLRFLKDKNEREQTMAVDMRAFGSAAHSALDEKERIKSRLRRMRHEWRLEKSTAEAVIGDLVQTERELDALIAQAEADEENFEEREKRAECRAMRDAYSIKASMTLKSGYLRAQVDAMANELLHLGDCAGLLGKQASAGAADKFVVSEPAAAPRDLPVISPWSPRDLGVISIWRST